MASVGLLLVSLLFVGAGMAQILWPETIANHKQRWDAIRDQHHGSERNPHDWMVTYIKRGGVLLVGIGLLLLGLAVDAL